jgi:hypothetical protein
MSGRTIQIVLSLLILAVSLTAGPGIAKVAFAQQYPQGEERRDREEYDRERAHEEREREEQRERGREGSHEGNHEAECNASWANCVNICNTIADNYQRYGCLANCNNFLYECRARR